jgi:DNA (cytosine-5)-methyltransferase 1/DNA (cytosine-5)-methyltransferase 3A
MNVLSLFNGMSVGRMALEALNIDVGTYYSSEIDKYATQATQALYPNTVQLGDVTRWREWDIDWSSIDLVTGGFPCQAWSIAGKQLGDKDERGMLFWTMLDIMKHVKYHNPKAHFMIENVKMKKEFEQYITTHTENALGHVHKILINSALVSAQNRNRYYWTNFPVEQPGDRGILLKDIIEHDCNNINSDGWHKWWSEKQDFQLRKKYSAICNDGSTDKAITMTARQYASWNGNFIKCGSMIGRKINPETGKRDDYNPNLKAEQRIEVRDDEKTGTLTTVQKDNLVISANRYRKLTPRECMRLQTIPEHHIDTLLNAGISNTQLYKMTGNAWTMEVIKHIFKGVTQ